MQVSVSGLLVIQSICGVDLFSWYFFKTPKAKPKTEGMPNNLGCFIIDWKNKSTDKHSKVAQLVEYLQVIVT